MTRERAAKIILEMIQGAESAYGHLLSTVEINALKKAYCALNPKPTTNADRIRAMTDEELADKFSLWCCRSTTDDSYCKSFGTCDKCWLDWLREEADNE